MPGVVKFQLKGVAELERALKELRPRVARSASGRALRAMAKPIVKRRQSSGEALGVSITTGEVCPRSLLGSLDASVRATAGRRSSVERLVSPLPGRKGLSGGLMESMMAAVEPASGESRVYTSLTPLTSGARQPATARPRPMVCSHHPVFSCNPRVTNALYLMRPPESH
jgi:hypothetical protein